jgi:hypothetical protein
MKDTRKQSILSRLSAQYQVATIGKPGIQPSVLKHIQNPRS